MVHQKLVDTLDLAYDSDYDEMIGEEVVSELWRTDEIAVASKALVLYKSAVNLAAGRVAARVALEEKSSVARNALISSLTHSNPKQIFDAAIRGAVDSDLGGRKGKGKGKDKGKGKGKDAKDALPRPPPGLDVDYLAFAQQSNMSFMTNEQRSAHVAQYVAVRPNGGTPSLAGGTAIRWAKAKKGGGKGGKAPSQKTQPGKGKGKGKKGQPKGKGKGKGKDPNGKGKGKNHQK